MSKTEKKDVKKVKKEPKKSRKKEEKKEEDASVKELVDALKLQTSKIQENTEALENYPLRAPFSYALIVRDKGTGEVSYIVDEIPLNNQEQDAFMKLKNILEANLQAPHEQESPIESFRRQLPSIMEKSRGLTKDLSNVGLRKIVHFLEGEIAGFGKIDSLLADAYIEDISCNGVNIPIYLWHRKYENIKTNLLFKEEDELDDFVMKIVHKAGKHVSIAYPTVDATLPGKHRLAVYYKKEVTPLGTSFTIRKFREDPYTVVDLINNDTMSIEVAAYLWLLIENKLSSIIIGATGAGKTTALNAVAGMIHPEQKIISVEEVAEVNLLRENWVSTIARSGFGIESSGEISLYELIRNSVRHRPDWIIVGEVRGEEAYVLFQTLATGHGGLCTMHAEDADTAIKRLTQPPMNIPGTIIPLMNCVVSVKHVKAPVLVNYGKAASKRKFDKVSEVISSGTIHDVFVWDNAAETYRADLSNSYLFRKISEKWSLPIDYVIEEFDKRKEVLQYLIEKNIRSHRSIATFLSKFYGNPELTYNEILESGGNIS
jgi:flagellar protein FlaI